jgi:hypothetical protein
MAWEIHLWRKQHARDGWITSFTIQLKRIPYQQFSSTSPRSNMRVSGVVFFSFFFGITATALVCIAVLTLVGANARAGVLLLRVSASLRCACRAC